jgi:hypothetical protein
LRLWVEASRTYRHCNARQCSLLSIAGKGWPMIQRIGIIVACGNLPKTQAAIARLLSTSRYRCSLPARKPFSDSVRGSTVEIGTIQRRLAWPLRNGDTHKARNVNKAGIVHCPSGGDTRETLERTRKGNTSNSKSGAPHSHTA